MTDNLKHLLGGYATGTLTPEENAVLMEAALDDQELFDALADDEALRRYLADPAFRKDLLKATTPRPARIPWIAGLAVAAASLSIGVFWTTQRDKVPAVQMAVIRPPVVEPLPPMPAPMPAPARKNPAAAQPAKQPVPVATTEVKAKKEAPESAKPLPPPAPAAVGGYVNSDALSVTTGTLAPVPKTPPAGAPAAFAPRRSIGGALARNALVAPPIVTGKITDVNATIITVNVGTTARVKIGDRLDILHDNAPIGYITITAAEPEFSVGKYTGESTPAIGDTAATPKK